MRGVYSASIKISALAAAKTLMHITAPASEVVEILSVEITNLSNETNEQLEATLQHITTLGTPTDTDLTPSKHELGDQASGSSVAGNVTASEPTYTANTEIGYAGFSSLSGYRYDPLPEERPTVANSASMGLRMLSTPTSLDVIVKMTYREIG
jgi:hypothetical protein